MDRPDKLTVAEAARRLGLTPDAVRKRLERGQLQGYRADGRWYVTLEGATDADGQTGPADRTDRTDGQDRQPDRTATGPDNPILRELVAELQARVASQEKQIDAMRDDLRRERDLRAQEGAEYRRLIGQVQALLPPPRQQDPDVVDVQQNQVQTSHSSTPRPWWRRWPWG